MPKYVVRTNCEYSLEIEAASEEEALHQADKIDVEYWAQAWAPYEAELEE